MQPRSHHARSHSIAERAGVCALEDYTCLTGESFAMRSLRAQLRRVSPHFRIALITGEEGTCKETVALALHRLNAESDATFVAYSATALIDQLHRIFSQSRPEPGRPFGLPEDSEEPSSTADLNQLSESLGLAGPRSTLFIADIDALSRSEQIHLRQYLYRIVASRGTMERPRLVFATGRDLRGLSGAGHFDRNLYRLISAVEILLPPLRSRPEDIPLITCSLLSRSAHSGISAPAFDGLALSRLQCHDWPGNVRELERVVELARQHNAQGIAAADGVIEANHLPPLGEFAPPSQQPWMETRIERLDDIIHNHVLDVLLRCSGNKVRAAERLGISRSTLYRMLEAGASSASQTPNGLASSKFDRTA